MAGIATVMPSLGPKLLATDEELRARFSRLQTDSDVAELLEIPVAHLRHILYEGRTRYPYHSFMVRKRNGEEREISAPHPTVKILQRKLLYVLTLVWRPRAPVHGFRSGRSIKTNAEPHVGKALVLNLDLKDFFPLIHFGRIYGLLKAEPFSIGDAAAAVVAQLCCREGVLPQGAPTWPIISNMICFRLDRQLSELAHKYHWYYTCYADDLTLSS